MRYQLPGPTGLRVSELFLGAMTFGEQGGVGAPPEECARILDTYAEAGGNVVDTAVNYRSGQSEEILGQLPKGQRDRFVLSAKYTVTAIGNHCKNLRHSLETSLRPAADGLHRHLLGAYVRRRHPGRGDPTRPR